MAAGIPTITDSHVGRIYVILCIYLFIFFLVETPRDPSFVPVSYSWAFSPSNLLVNNKIGK